MPSNEEPFAKQFNRLKERRSGGGRSDDDDSNDNCCTNLSMCVVLILKIIVVATSTFVLFDSCSIGYMYDYLLKSLIVAGVIVGTPCLCAVCIFGSVAADSVKAFAFFTTFVMLVLFGGAIAQIVLVGQLYDQHPEDTLLFFDTFWSNPIFPSNCTQGEDLRYVEIGMGLVKYDSFTLMFTVLVLACFCSCAIVCTCCAAASGADFEEIKERRAKAAARGTPIAVV